MKIGVLSFRSAKNNYSAEVKRLVKEIRLAGHTARVFKMDRFQTVYAAGSPRLLYSGKPFPKYDALLARPGVLSDIAIKLSIIPELELMGIPVINKFGPIVRAKDKVKTAQLLNHYNIPIPRTVIFRKEGDLKAAVRSLGGFPIIMKTPHGSFGKGVVIVESMRALKSLITWDDPLYILQEFVKYAKGSDIRLFVIDGEVVASMKRVAKKGEFRSNIELGGTGVPVKVTEEEKQIAIRATQALDLHFSGVDIMRSKSGPVVIEVNANPGFKGLEKAVDDNVAEKLVAFVIRYAQGM